MQAATVTALVAQLDRIDLQLAEMRIAAPYGGHIQARHVDEGAVVAPGQPILDIVETDALEIRVGLPPELTMSLREEQIQVAASGSRLPVRIARMAPQIDQRTRTREVVLAVQSDAQPAQSVDASPFAAGGLPVGTAVQVDIRVPVRATGQWVKTQALTAGPRGLWAVFVAVPIDSESPASDDRDGLATHTIERRPVELLRSHGSWSEIRGPLNAEDALVVEGLHCVVPGQAVTCESSQSPPLLPLDGSAA